MRLQTQPQAPSARAWLPALLASVLPACSKPSDGSGPPDAAASSIETAASNPLPADGATAAAITVTVRDAQGRPLAGEQVQLASTGSGNTLVQPAGLTDALGKAVGLLSSTVAEQKTVSALVDPAGLGVVLAAQPTIEFDPDATNLSADLSQIASDAAGPIVADGVASAGLEVVVRDAQGNAVPDVQVLVWASGAGNALQQVALTTDAQGRVGAALSSIKAEIKTVGALLDPLGAALFLASTVDVEFVGDASTLSAALSSATATPAAALIADGVETSVITVTVRDANGNPVPGIAVELAASGSSNALVQPAAPTGADGTASGTLASTAAEVKSVTVLAYSPGPLGAGIALPGSLLVEFLGDPSNLSAGLTEVSALPLAGVVADGVEQTAITVVVRDGNGNPVAGRTVLIAASGSANTIVQPSGPTDAAGIAVGTLSSIAAEAKVVSALVDPGTLDLVPWDQPSIEFIGDASNLSSALSTLSGSPGAGLLANGTETAVLTVVARDANGNSVPGVEVSLSASGAGNALAQPAALTDAAGTTAGTLASMVAETKTVAATLDPLGAAIALAQTAGVTFVADASNVSPTLSTVQASPAQDLIADGADSAAVDVVVRDGYGNLLPGLAVTLGASGSGNLLSQPAQPTDSDGAASGALAAVVAESKVVTAIVQSGAGPVLLDDQPVVIFIGDPANLSASLSTLTVDPASGVLADGASTVRVDVVVRDVNGNAVTGQTVVLSASGSGNAISQPGLTDGAGATLGTVASTVAEAKQISAVADPSGQAIGLAGTETALFVWPVPGRRFVRISGNDGDDGLSPATAWATMGRAALSAAPGTEVFVGAGTYVETVLLSTDGTSSDPIRFAADENGEMTGDAGTVTLDAAGGDAGFHVDGADHVEIEGFWISGAWGTPGAGIWVGASPSTGVVLRANRVTSSRRGVYVENASNLAMDGNRVSQNGGGPMPAGGGGEGVVLSGCSAPEIVCNLVYANQAEGLWLTDGTTGAWISANTLYANGASQIHVDGLLNNATLWNNLAASGYGDGIVLELGSTAQSNYNLSFAHVGLDWLGLLPGLFDISQDPLLIDPDGADGLLGGAGEGDDSFELDVAGGSPAIDAGSAGASALALPGGETLAERTTRVDGVPDGTSPDGAAANLGYHSPLAPGAPPALGADDARLAAGIAGDGRPALRTFDASAAIWSPPHSGPYAGAEVRWLQARRSLFDDGEELLAVASQGTGTALLSMLRWSGVAWHEDWSASDLATDDQRAFDLCVASDGSAMVVHSDGGANPRWSRRSQGVWSDPAAVFGAAPGTGGVLWVELEAAPTGGQMSLVYADQNLDLFAVQWDGAAWAVASAATLETGLRSVTVKSFDSAFESLSGDQLVIWAGPSNQEKWAVRSSGSASWTYGSDIPSLGFTTASYDLAADPASDRVAMVGLEDDAAGDEPKVAVWTGSAWSDVARLETGTNVTPGAQPGDQSIAAGWLPDGRAVALYADDQTGRIDWGLWQSGSGWSLQPDVLIAGKGITQSIACARRGTSGTLVVLFSDDLGALYGASHDGSGWTVHDAGTALLNGLTASDCAPFDVVTELE